MEILEAINDGLVGWQSRELPASDEAIKVLVNQSPIELPNEYLSLLKFSNGGEGDLGIEPGWFQLWPVEEVLKLNEAYEVSEWYPGFFGFGSNGGQEMLAFDTRLGTPFTIYMIPFMSINIDNAIRIAPDFTHFAMALGRVLEDA